MTTHLTIVDELRRQASALGFEAFGITGPDPDPHWQGALRAFLEAGYHGTMDWMATTLERRENPKVLWPDAQSIVMVAMNYGPDSNPMESLQEVNCGTISAYARHRDYHDVIKGRLKTLADKLGALARNNHLDCDAKVFVDTAPIMEKPLAQRAGLGWQGKHTNLVSRQHGSWLFLGSIFTTLKLPTDRMETDYCGSCTNCLDICPTDAFPAPYQLDARRCISYLTIEHKGPIPIEFRRPMGNRIYGCDDCLAVCPWNKFARVASEAKLASPGKQPNKKLDALMQLDDAQFRKRFSGSPVKRIGRDRFVRNCLIAAGNSQDPLLLPIVQGLCCDNDPVVREAAQWATGELKRISK